MKIICSECWGLFGTHKKEAHILNTLSLIEKAMLASPNTWYYQFDLKRLKKDAEKVFNR